MLSTLAIPRFTLNFFHGDFFIIKVVTKSKKKTKRKSKKTQKLIQSKKTHLIFVELACGGCQSSGVTQLRGCWNLHGEASRGGWILSGGGGSSGSQVRRSIDIRLWHTFLDQFNIQVYFCLFFSDHTTNRNI